LTLSACEPDLAVILFRPGSSAQHRSTKYRQLTRRGRTVRLSSCAQRSWKRPNRKELAKSLGVQRGAGKLFNLRSTRATSAGEITPERPVGCALRAAAQEVRGSKRRFRAAMVSPRQKCATRLACGENQFRLRPNRQRVIVQAVGKIGGKQ